MKQLLFNCLCNFHLPRTAAFLYTVLLIITPETVRSQTGVDWHLDREVNIASETNSDYLVKWAFNDSIRYYSSKARAVALANKMGYPVEGISKSRHFKLVGTDELGQPSYVETNNRITADFLGTSALYPGGDLGLNLTGNGTTLAVWEIGRPLLTHAALTGRVTQKDNLSAGIDNHATHVSGTLIGADLNTEARGMSYEASLNAYDIDGNFSEMAAASVSPINTRISSHSYGLICGWSYEDDGWYWYGNTAISQTEDYKFGLYNSEAVALDNIANNAPFHLPVFAAGNDRNNYGPAPGSAHKVLNSSGAWVSSTAVRNKDGNDAGYGCIPAYNCAKNLLTVGAVQVEEDDGLFFSSMSSFSGWGPTDDGRIKPDIVAPGVNVYSSVATSDLSYDALSGTSMATPAIAGSVNLLLQHYSSLNPGLTLRASALKALVIHTASSEENGPEYSSGWGTANIGSAAELLNQDAMTQGRDRVYSRDSIANGSVRNRTFYHDGLSPVKVTVVWTDPAGPVSTNTLNPTTLRLVNDLDVRVISAEDGTVYYPWVLNPVKPDEPATRGDNFRDNVEQVYIESLPPGSYTIRVTHKGTLTGGKQLFSMILSGRASESTCEGNTLITDCSGVISDGSGNNNYSNNLDCSWTIAPPGATSITLTFTSFRTEDFEFVTVYDGEDENAPVLGEFEGSSLPPTVTANSGKMFITFKTDLSGTYAGWSANFSCSQQSLSVNPDALTFASGGGANATTVTANCAWTIQNIPLWLSVTPVSGSVSTVIGITCDPNTSTQDRSAVLNLSGCGGVTKTITIGQFGCTNPSIPALTASGTTNLCTGQSVTLTAENICSGCSVEWSNGQTTQSIVVSAQGSYTARFKNSCGTGNYSTPVVVTAGQVPTTVPTVSASGTTDLCPGQSVTLTAGNICSGCSVEWSNGQTTQSIVVSAQGSYTARFKNSCGTGNYSTPVVITAGQVPTTVPTVSASGTTDLCPGQSVTLTAGNICSGCSVKWSNGQTGNSITVSSAGTYYAANSNSCGEGAASNSITVSVKTGPTVPVITANGPTSFCQNGTVTLIATNVCADCTTSWSNGLTGPFINVSTTGNYTASYTNTCGQGLPSVVIPVTVVPPPVTPVIAAMGSTILCPENTVQIAATNICNGCSTVWSNGQTGASITVSSASSYQAYYTNMCGNSNNSNTVLVTSQSYPVAPVITASGSTALCPGQSVTLSANNICQGCTVNWSNNQTGPSITVSSSGNYTARYQNICGLGQSSNNITTEVTGPYIPVVQVTNLCNLSAPAGGSNYQWYFNNIPIQGANSPFYVAVVTGFYHVAMTSPTGCDGVSGAVLAQVCISGTENPGNTDAFLVYPNPASRNLTIECPPDAEEMDIRMDLFDSKGTIQATIFQGRAGGAISKIECNLPELPQGIYSYRIQAPKFSVWGQLVIIE